MANQLKDFTSFSLFQFQTIVASFKRALHTLLNESRGAAMIWVVTVKQSLKGMDSFSQRHGGRPASSSIIPHSNQQQEVSEDFHTSV